MTKCILCHKFWHILGNLTFLEVGKEGGEITVAHSQCELAYALLLVVSQSHYSPTRGILKRGPVKPPGGCFLALRWQMSELEGTL